MKTKEAIEKRIKKLKTEKNDGLDGKVWISDDELFELYHMIEALEWVLSDED